MERIIKLEVRRVETDRTLARELVAAAAILALGFAAAAFVAHM